MVKQRLPQRAIAFLFQLLFWSILSGGLASSTLAGPNEAEDVVRQVYDLVSFDAGTRPDWQQVRSRFLPEAVITLRTAKDKISVFTLDGFVQDFVDFIDRSKADERGFHERVVQLTGSTYGDVAEYKVVYEAQLQGSQRPPQQGLDIFLLIRTADGWKIAAITNELVSPGVPLPAGLH